VDRLYLKPPRSSEQILHPEKYFDEEDDPLKIALPEPAELSGPDWEKIFENSLGQWQIQVLLQHTADPVRALRAAPGWEGDTYAVYRLKNGGEPWMAWAVAFETEKDAAEFWDAENKGLRRKHEARGPLEILDPAELPNFLAAAQTADLVLGSRYIRGDRSADRAGSGSGVR